MTKQLPIFTYHLHICVPKGDIGLHDCFLYFQWFGYLTHDTCNTV